MTVSPAKTVELIEMPAGEFLLCANAKPLRLWPTTFLLTFLS